VKKNTLNLTATQKALKVYDALLPKLDKNLDIEAEKSQEKALAALSLFDEAEKKVKEAFFEDTKNVNSYDNCMIVGIKWLRELVEKYPPSKH
jgi:hypothetical protein